MQSKKWKGDEPTPAGSAAQSRVLLQQADLLGCILSWLDTWEVLRSATRVCGQWNKTTLSSRPFEVITRRWKVDNGREKGKRFSNFIRRHAIRIRRLHVRSASPWMLEVCKNLEYFQCENMPMDADIALGKILRSDRPCRLSVDCLVWRLAESSVIGETVRCHSIRTTLDTQTITGIRNLTVHNHPECLEALQEMLETGQLHSLVLNTIIGIDELAVMGFSPHLHTWSVHCSDQGLIPLLQKQCPALTDVRLNSPRFSEQELCALNDMKHLKRLDICDPFYLVDSFTPALAAVVAAAQTRVMEMTDDLDFTCISRPLETFGLMYDQYSDMKLRKLPPNAKRLVLVGDNNVIVDGEETYPQCTWLEISTCEGHIRGWKVAQIQKVLRMFPNLVHLDLDRNISLFRLDKLNGLGTSLKSLVCRFPSSSQARGASKRLARGRDALSRLQVTRLELVPIKNARHGLAASNVEDLFLPLVRLLRLRELVIHGLHSGDDPALGQLVQHAIVTAFPKLLVHDCFRRF